MKQQIYLSLFLSIELLTACGDHIQPPTAKVTPTPTPTPTPVVAANPSPIASVPPPQIQPPVTATPVPAQVPKIPSTPPARLPSSPTIVALPKSLYPTPSPIAIPVPTDPVQTKANPKPDPLSKLKLKPPATDPAQQITPVGIGSAKIGMSFQELKEQMGKGFEFVVKTGFLDGFDAIAVTKAGTIQYYIPYPAGTNFTNEDRIEHLMTDNPNYRTAQGIGPGTSIDRAAAVYGSATISLSKENESREFIRFTQHPNGLAFRPKPPKNRTFAGEYPESNEEYLNTQTYDNRAAIGQITVSCTEDKCKQEHDDH